MARHLNPDASAAVASARKGNCRDALKHLYDAAPHNQTLECGTEKAKNLAADFKTANVIVSGLCAIDRSGGKYKTDAFQGVRSRKRRR